MRRFSYPVNPGKLELRALFAPEAGIHVTESRLSNDHRATTQADGRVLVEVLGPASLRAEFRDQAQSMQALYS